MEKQRHILITGSAGFIGHHLALALAHLNYEVIGLDALNDYYDPQLKLGRLRIQGFDSSQIRYKNVLHSSIYPRLAFIQLDLTDELALNELFRQYQFDIVINLAAQAGVRYSLEHPQSYVASNLVGFANLLECCRKYTPRHLLFASSSSVYGQNQDTPFKTSHNTDYPLSFYAATKKANEVMAHSYSHLYNLPVTGLRFFTVYGPWGRPDMAYYSFAQAIEAGSPIKIFNYGDMFRDFTYVDDVINSIVRLLHELPVASKGVASSAPYKIYNIGNSKPEQLLELVAILERLLHKKAVLDLQPMPPGDVPATFADVQDLMETVHYRPQTSLETGLGQFIEWFRNYYQKQSVPIAED